MQSVALFFNTAIQGGGIIEDAGNALMAPVRVLFSGKTYSIEGTAFREIPGEESAIVRIIKVAVSVLLLLPLVVAGCMLKGLAYLKASVRDRGDALARYLLPVPRYEPPFFLEENFYRERVEALSCHDRKVDDELTSAASADILLEKLPVIVKYLVETVEPLKFIMARATGFAEMSKNRYSNIHPYDYNIPQAGGYINASKIVFGDLDFIATQAPLISTSNMRTETISDFIDMVLTSHSSTIVTLLNETERGKAEPYWEESLSLTGGRTIVCEAQESLVQTPRGERLVQRTLVVKDKEDKEIKRITQFHYEHWPVHGPPSEELFDELLKKIEKHGEKGPLITHCSAGVGRTGTFIAALGLRKQLREELAKNREAKPTLNMARVMLELRLQRDQMIQSVSQIAAVETAIRRHYLELTA